MGMKDEAKSAAEKALKDSSVAAAIAQAQDAKAQTSVIVVMPEHDKDKEKKKPLRGLQAFRNA